MKVEIWSDVVCPWCYLGKRRFEQALARFEHNDDVLVQWRSFQLDPSVPPGTDEPIGPWLQRKLRVSPERLRQMHAHLEGLAMDAGLTVHLDAARVTNTFDAHRLLHLARRHGIEAKATERLFAAHFTEGVGLGKTENLTALFAELGLEPGEIEEALRSDALADEVQEEIEEARSLGIGGVPCFVIDRTFGISGAQETDVMLDVLREAWRKRAA